MSVAILQLAAVHSALRIASQGVEHTAATASRLNLTVFLGAAGMAGFAFEGR